VQLGRDVILYRFRLNAAHAGTLPASIQRFQGERGPQVYPACVTVGLVLAQAFKCGRRKVKAIEPEEKFPLVARRQPAWGLTICRNCEAQQTKRHYNDAVVAAVPMRALKEATGSGL